MWCQQALGGGSDQGVPLTWSLSPTPQPPLAWLHPKASLLSTHPLPPRPDRPARARGPEDAGAHPPRRPPRKGSQTPVHSTYSSRESLLGVALSTHLSFMVINKFPLANLAQHPVQISGLGLGLRMEEAGTRPPGTWELCSVL